MKNFDSDVVIVGGGPAGLSAAYILANAGKKVVVLERGDFCGSKNMFGGAIYTKPTLEIYPDFIEQSPLERKLVKHSYALLGEKDGTVISYDNQSDAEGYMVLRPEFDRWCAKKAQEAGAFIVPQTLVESLICEDGKFVGIKTACEEYRANITILADGVNSILAKKHGLRKQINPKDVALSVKQTLELDKEKIEDRFNLNGDDGCAYTIMGGPMLEMTGLGFIYTNLNTVSIGLGITLEDLKNSNRTPYDILENLKEHPTIKSLIKGAKLKEYSAHLIPEGGFNAVPALYDDGFMITGDAAMLVNNVHWEGTNLAMISGKYAALTAIEALNKNDCSKNSLKLYKKMLENSFIMKDLKSYKNVIKNIENNSKSFLGYYPRKINEFFNLFTSVDGISKKEKYREFIFNVLKERGVIQLASDGTKIVKLMGDAVL